MFLPLGRNISGLKSDIKINVFKHQSKQEQTFSGWPPPQRGLEPVVVRTELRSYRFQQEWELIPTAFRNGSQLVCLGGALHPQRSSVQSLALQGFGKPALPVRTHRLAQLAVSQLAVAHCCKTDGSTVRLRPYRNAHLALARSVPSHISIVLKPEPKQ